MIDVRFIRLDDFPYGDAYTKKLFEDNKSQAYDAFMIITNILSTFGVPHILGVTPFLLSEEDIEFLNSLKSPQLEVCMHGFDHAVDKNVDWSKGGEFEGMSVDDINTKYQQALDILMKINKFDVRHFIPPFNAINQELLDVLHKNGVSYIHTCDKEFYRYRQYTLKFYDMHVFMPILYHSYDYVHEVVENFEKISLVEYPITLHWFFDLHSSNAHWVEDYVELGAMFWRK